MEKTVAELRRLSVGKLAKRSINYESDALGTIERAEKAMNSFYRFAGFAVRKFYYENDGRRYVERVADELEKKETEWMERLEKYLAEFNASVRFSGIYPSIVEREAIKPGCHNDLMLTYWYN